MLTTTPNPAILPQPETHLTTGLPIYLGRNVPPVASWHARCCLGRDIIVTDGPTAEAAIAHLLAALPAAQAARALVPPIQTYTIQQEA